jgi:ATP-binding cassette subfamily C protein
MKIPWAGQLGELRVMLARFQSAFWVVAGLSAVLNVLTLGGSIYLMLVYDSVLPSHSVQTLVGLFILILLVYVFQGILDHLRQRILSDVGNAVDRELSPRIQRAMSEVALRHATSGGDGLMPMRDLDAVRTWLSSAGPTTLIDLPWMLFFMGMLCLLHPYLALTALAGATVLIGLTVMTDRATRAPTQDLTRVASWRNGIAESNLRHVEAFAALGMRERMRLRWEQVNHVYHGANNQLAQTVNLYGGISKVLRMALQSALLTVGAVLVINGKASAGVIFASSILAGRALAPIDSAIANWRGFSSARLGWTRLAELLAKVPAPAAAGVRLPLPQHNLVVSQLAVAPPGSQRVTVSALDFQVEAGQALGIIGPSAAGKTSLARALVGLWRPLRGSIRFDGATFDQWEPDHFGVAIGYLPQTVELVDGTIAQNIARFDPEAPAEAIIAAARAAGIHEMVVQMPEGYKTSVGRAGVNLSAGQRQRVGLARALFGDPFLVVLDEPNSNLDADGDIALEMAISGVRQRRGIVVIIAHRPSALVQASHVLVMREGRGEAFGERDDVLRRLTRSANAVVKTAKEA